MNHPNSQSPQLDQSESEESESETPSKSGCRIKLTMKNEYISVISVNGSIRFNCEPFFKLLLYV